MKRIEVTAKQQRCALQARPYQVEIANIARNESIIAKLNTGLGKTFIAVMVIKHHLPETFKPVAEGGKRIIFIAKTGIYNLYFVSFISSSLGLSACRVFAFPVARKIRRNWYFSWTDLTNSMDRHLDYGIFYS